MPKTPRQLVPVRVLACPEQSSPSRGLWPIGQARQAQRVPVRTFVLLILIASLLAGCPLGLSGTGQVSTWPTPGPQPEQLVIFDGVTPRTLEPGHASYAPLVQRLNELIASIDTPLYAYYPPERVATEIAPLSHLEAIYSRNVTLIGKGYQVKAARLIVVIAHGEKMILTLAEGQANWSACEESRAIRFDALVKAIKEQTGVALFVTGQ